jgi:peptide/nickel transport system substrate-binding protein
VWQLKLQSGVTFHDGKPLTADDVLYTWKRVLDPKTASGGAAAIANIDLERTSKVSDTEIRVVLSRPQIDFPYLLSGRELSIVADGAKSFEKPVGTGPFSFVSFTPGQRSLFKRNPDYWGGAPNVDELEMISIADATARVNALIGGQVDAIENLPFTDAKAHQNDSQMRVLITKTPTCIPFVMQTQVKPFDNPDVREAMKLAVDRPKVVESAFLGYGQVGNDVFGLGTPSYDTGIPQREYDPERAKALLKNAGAEGLSVVLNTNPGTVGNVESCQAFAEQAKAAGIDVKVKSWDSAKFGSDIYNQTPLFHTYWNFPNEIMFPYAFTKGAPYNESQFESDRFVRLYAEAEATIDDAKRKELYGELERETADGGYVIWGYLDFTDAVSPKVQGAETHPYFNLGAFQFKNWWMS